MTTAMPLASQDYPLLNLFWTMLELFLWVLWFFLLFRIIIDIFRSHDLGGWGKALWLIFVIVLPFLGVFVYLIARGSSMGERDARQAQEVDAATRSLHPICGRHVHQHRRRTDEAGRPARSGRDHRR